MVIKLKELRITPCKEWLVLFENGKLDAHKAFEEHGEQYGWLYAYSDYDLIAWEIENDCFNWEAFYLIAPCFCKESFKHNKSNWKDFSWKIAEYYSERFDRNTHNWKKDYSLNNIEYDN